MRKKRRVADMEDSENGVAEAVVRAKSEEEMEDKEDKEEAHFKLGHVRNDETERAPVAARGIEGLF
ncbi:hypothetical protein HMPREF1624_04595 [Sporothrix schenckii ATCC 58251]|uniref:Uncharacterized protein n=1 Tax=Sporothrix schenckii (strain ATCC 58251 / de Perez 2211183) TaxID=1391915 RepID=U7PY61_SPOS1|nr:hypothetical protein HMPREF1624_04595 [Sporothrix schenckii ATCC 58251]